MKEDYIIDDAIVNMAQNAVSELHLHGRDLENLANSQIRKFWDILKMQHSSERALRLAMHQSKKASKEEDDLNRNKYSKPEKIQAANLKKTFWQKIEAVVNDDRFAQDLKEITGITIEKALLLELQICYAETIYSEILYRKAQGGKA